MSNRDEIAQEIIKRCLLMQSSGVNQGTSGNISMRYKDGMLITPSGMPYDKMEIDDIVFVNGEGVAEKDKIPSSEWRFHLSILKDNPSFNAVIHNHATYSSMVSILKGVDCIPAIHYMVAIAGGKKIPLVDYATFGTKELSDNISRQMRGYKACILRNHGLLAADVSMDKAWAVMIEVEHLAKLYMGIKAAGDFTVVSDEDMDKVIEKFKNYGLNVKHKKH